MPIDVEKGEPVSNGTSVGSKQKATTTRSPPPDDQRQRATNYAPIWSTYVEKADKYDTDMIARWNDSIENFLLFTGLFAAILSAFLVYLWSLLLVDDGKATTDALLLVTQQLVNISSRQPLSPSLTVEPPVFVPPVYAVRIHALWLIALFITLFAAVLAMLVKEWLSAYIKDPKVVPQERVEQRQDRYNGLVYWNVQGIVAFLPLAIHLAVLLFISGLVLLTWQVSPGTAKGLTALLSVGVFTYVLSALLPFFDQACPYKSPLYSLLDWLQRSLQRDIVRGVRYWRWLSLSETLRPTFDNYEAACRQKYHEWEAKVVRSSVRGVRYVRWCFSPDSYRKSFEEFADECGRTHPGPEGDKDRMIKLQYAALAWLAQSPDDTVQREARLFLSWAVKPITWWEKLSDEARATANSMLAQDRSLKLQRAALAWLSQTTESLDDRVQEEVNLLLSRAIKPNENVVLSSPVAPQSLSEYQSLDAQQKQRCILIAEFNYNEYFNPENSELPKGQRFVKSQEPSDQTSRVLRQLTWLLTNTRSQVFSLELVCGITSLASCVSDYWDNEVIVTKYLQVLRRALIDTSESGGYWIHALELAENETDIGSRLWQCLECLLPALNQPRPHQWFTEQQRADKIAFALTQCLPHHFNSIKGICGAWDRDENSLWSAIRWTRSITSSLTQNSGKETVTQTLKQIFAVQIDMAQSNGLWKGRRRSHAVLDLLQYLPSSAHWDLFEGLFDAWIRHFDQEKQDGRPEREMIGSTGFRLLLDQIRTSTTPLCVPAILFVYSALHGAAPDQETPRLVTEDIQATIETLVSIKWLDCMRDYGIGYLSYSLKGEHQDTGTRLCRIFKRCIRQIFHRKPQVIKDSNVLKDYQNIDPRFVEALLSMKSSPAESIERSTIAAAEAGEVVSREAAMSPSDDAMSDMCTRAGVAPSESVYGAISGPLVPEETNGRSMIDDGKLQTGGAHSAMAEPPERGNIGVTEESDNGDSPSGDTIDTATREDTVPNIGDTAFGLSGPDETGRTSGNGIEHGGTGRAVKTDMAVAATALDNASPTAGGGLGE